jgi:hypothetical protein
MADKNVRTHQDIKCQTASIIIITGQQGAVLSKDLFFYLPNFCTFSAWHE